MTSYMSRLSIIWCNSSIFIRIIESQLNNNTFLCRYTDSGSDRIFMTLERALFSIECLHTPFTAIQQNIWQVFDAEMTYVSWSRTRPYGTCYEDRQREAGLTSSRISSSALSPSGSNLISPGGQITYGTWDISFVCVWCHLYECVCLSWALQHLEHQAESLLYYNILWIIIQQCLLVVPHKEFTKCLVNNVSTHHCSNIHIDISMLAWWKLTKNFNLNHLTAWDTHKFTVLLRVRYS